MPVFANALEKQIYELGYNDYAEHFEGLKTLENNADAANFILTQYRNDPSRVLVWAQNYVLNYPDSPYIPMARNIVSKIGNQVGRVPTPAPEANRPTVVINLFGGPGTGKTTAAFEIAEKLKKDGYVVEYAPEYAKELAWTRNDRNATSETRAHAQELLDGSYTNQTKLYEEQHARVRRLLGQCDFVVTDSPALLGCMYLDRNGLSYALQEVFENRALNDFRAQNNFNLFVERGDIYEQEGRLHTEEQSKQIDRDLRKFLDDNNIFFGSYSHSQIEQAIFNAVKTYDRIQAQVLGKVSTTSVVKDTSKVHVSSRKENIMADEVMAQEEKAQEAQEKDGPTMKLSSKWVSSPFEKHKIDKDTHELTDEPVVSKNGNKLYSAYATMPNGTIANGVDLSGYSVEVNYAWGEERLAVMEGRRASGEDMLFDLGDVANQDGKVYMRPPTSPDGQVVEGKAPMQVDAWEVTKAVKAGREAYAKAMAEERAALQEAPRQAQGAVTPSAEQEAAVRSAQAQAKSAPQQEHTLQR